MVVVNKRTCECVANFMDIKRTGRRILGVYKGVPDFGHGRWHVGPDLDVGEVELLSSLMLRTDLLNYRGGRFPVTGRRLGRLT